MSLSHRVYSNNSSSCSTPFTVKQSFITSHFLLMILQWSPIWSIVCKAVFVRHASLTPPSALIHRILCSLITKSLFWPKHQHQFHRQRSQHFKHQFEPIEPIQWFQNNVFAQQSKNMQLASSQWPRNDCCILSQFHPISIAIVSHETEDDYRVFFKLHIHTLMYSHHTHTHTLINR